MKLIYSLVDANRETVYIGQTSNIWKRVAGHLDNIVIRHALQDSLLVNGYFLLPHMMILEEVEDADADFIERAWIAQLAYGGSPLLNRSHNPKWQDDNSIYFVLRLQGYDIRQAWLTAKLAGKSGLTQLFEDTIKELLWGGQSSPSQD